MSSGRPAREDADHFERLLNQRRMTDLWHFTPLCNVPCIFFHGALFGIEELDRRGLIVPGRESREDDISKGVGNVVKTSTIPYWNMLGKDMRDGIPHVLIRYATDPILWADTTFGDRNVWENGWVQGNSYEFAEQYVFVRSGQYAGSSPPEIYIERELPLGQLTKSLYTYLGDETRLLEGCLNRLSIACPVRVLTAGERSWPFPDRCHDDYIRFREGRLARVEEYFGALTIESLGRGVEIDP